MKLTDYQQSMARKILVYGAPKTGKTDFVGQLAATKKLWWFDLEDGIKTLVHSPRITPAMRDNIELFHIPDTQIMPIAARTMLKVIKGQAGTVCENHGAWNCPVCKAQGAPVVTIDLSSFTNNDVLVIDSVSQLASSAMNDIQKDVISKDKFDQKPDWDDYANQGRIMDRIFSIMQQAPFNVVTISHEQLVEMEDGKKKIVPIGGTSQFSKTFAKYFDDVVYCEKVNGNHKFASGSKYSNSIVLGSRSGKELESKESSGTILELFK